MVFACSRWVFSPSVCSVISHLRVVELPVGVGLRLVELFLRGVHESLPAFVLLLGLHRGFDAVGDIADQRVIVVAERVRSVEPLTVRLIAV